MRSFHDFVGLLELQIFMNPNDGAVGIETKFNNDVLTA